MFISVNGHGKPLNSYDMLRGILVARAHSLGFEKHVSSMLRVLSKTMAKIARGSSPDGKVDSCVTYWTESRNGTNIIGSNVTGYLEREVKNFSELDQFDDMILQLDSFAAAYYNLADLSGDWLKKALKKEPPEYPSGYMQNRRIVGFNGTSSSYKPQHMMLFSALHAMGPRLDGIISDEQIHHKDGSY